jgi:hypothetical protein
LEKEIFYLEYITQIFFSFDVSSTAAWFKEAIQLDSQIVQSWDDVLALSVLWNKESLLDQCLKEGADPRAAKVTAKQLTVLELASQNGQTNLYKKLLAAGLAKQLLQSRF